MKKNYFKILTILILTFTLQSLQAATWYVRKNATGDGKAPNYALATLAAAISAASAGDIIDIGSGEFAESNLVVNKQLTIQGTKGYKTIFKATGGTFVTFTAAGLIGNNMIFSNISIQGYNRVFSDVPSNSVFSFLDIYGSITDANLWNGDVITYANGATNVRFEFLEIGGYWNSNQSGAYTVNSANGATLFKIADGNSASNLSFVKVVGYDAGVVFYASQSVNPSSSANVSNVLFDYCEFGQIKYKGIYAEKLSGLTITNSFFEEIGQTLNGQPAAIDIDLKWQTYTGNINITNTTFGGCGIPNSGTDLNGAAIIIKSRDFGSFASPKAIWNGNTTIDRCFFTKNNAGIRIGESFNGSGTLVNENNSQGGTTSIINSVFIDNSQGTAGTYNHFDIRNVATNNLNVTNTYFKRGGTVQNPSITTAFTAGQVSDVNSNGGTTSVNSTNLIGPYLAELTTGTFTGYATFNSAFAAIPSGGNIYILEDLGPTSGIPALTTTKSFGLYYPSGEVEFANNITINSGAELTLYGNIELGGTININVGKLVIPDYTSLFIEGIINTSNGSVNFSSNYGFLGFETASTNFPKITGIPFYISVYNDFGLVENLTVKNLEIGDSELQVNGFTLTILEDLLGDGDISALNGSVKISGTGTIAKIDNYIEVKDFNIDRAAGIEITNGLEIIESLSLKNGDIFPSSKTNDDTSGSELYLGPALILDNSGPTPGSIVVNNNYDLELGKVFSAANLTFTFPMATSVSGIKTNVPITINLNASTVFEDEYNGVPIGSVYLEFNRGLNSNAPFGTTKYAGISWNIQSEDLSNVNYTATFGYNENTFVGGLTEAELAVYLYNGTTNPPLKRIVAANGLVKNTTNNTLTFNDTKSGEFMFLADNGTIPLTTVDFPVVNEYKQKGYATIQAAIDHVTTTDFDLIKIAAGTYAERVNVNKQLYFEGNNAGVEPWNWSKPATIIKPNTTDFTTPLFTFAANNISVDGITFEGTNDLLSDAAPRNINGKANRVATAISKVTTDNNTGYTVKNNRFLDFSGRGVSLFATNAQSGLTVENNSFDNIIGINNNISFGIISSNYNADINNNRLTRCDRGIQVQYSLSDFSDIFIRNNQISAYRYGIFNVGSASISYPTLTISNNIITKANYSSWTADGLTVNSTAVLEGILLANLAGDNSILIESNTVDGAYDGIYATGIRKSINSERFLIKNGTYINNRIGIWNYNTGITSYSTNVVIDGATITNSSFIGVINENATSTGTFVSEMTLKGGTLINHTGSAAGNYDPIQIFGTKARLNGLNDTKISGGNLRFINIVAPAMTGLTVDAKDVTFDGTVNGQTFNNYKPSATFDLTLRTAVKARINDGEDVGNTTAGIVTIPTTLPVNLISFSAKAQTQGALLSWSTASETNNKNFILEKSLDGKTFVKFADIIGKGTYSGLSNYQFIDFDFKSSTYYRLKQIDLNGTETVYNDLIRYVKDFDNAIELTIYPNPTQSKLFVKNATSDVSIVDLSGRILETKSSNNTIEFDVEKYTSGVYFVKSGSEIKKFIKQ